ncbi:SDR family NAD(P)-dependent oxidoreductase [Rhodococcus hoagii]|nr:SDR family NAD(P)-dependent oxidoreductase [Prescottella equi]
MSGRVAGRSRSSPVRPGAGRSHALRLAEEGADIIALDIADGIDTVTPPIRPPPRRGPCRDGARGRGPRTSIVAEKADVRDFDAVRAVVDRGVAELGRIDVVVANAGIFNPANRAPDHRGRVGRRPRRKPQGRLAHVQGRHPAPDRAGAGGSIVITSSTAGLKGAARTAAYGPASTPSSD